VCKEIKVNINQMQQYTIQYTSVYFRFHGNTAADITTRDGFITVNGKGKVIPVFNSLSIMA
jgi:glutamine synthetase type III